MWGVIWGLLSSAAFGLIPFFTIPLTSSGISVETAIVYRFTIAALAMGILLFFRHVDIRVSWKDFGKLAFLSSLYLFAVIAYFHSFRLLPSSVAGTIQFLYPVMVMPIMIFFFHERFNWRVALAVAMGVGGVAFLSIASAPAGEEIFAGEIARHENYIFWGVSLALLAGLGNALYMVGIQVAKMPNINGLVMTFYVMTFGSVYALVNALCSNSLQWIYHPSQLFLVSMLALITAVFSNLTLILCIKAIGSTMAAILGVMEPLTAVIIGIIVFNEPFTPSLLIGVLLIIFSVIIAVFRSSKQNTQ